MDSSSQVTQLEKTSEQKLLKQIYVLKQTLLSKDQHIVLEETIKKITIQLKETKDELKQYQVLIKTYNKNLYTKNVEVSQLQEKNKIELERVNTMKTNQLSSLKQILTEQEKQINELMDDHARMVNTFVEVYNTQQFNYDEKNLLKNFNAELESQIEQLENQNEAFIKEITELRKQIELQNKQGEDLVSQMEVMFNHIKESKINASK